MKTQIVTITLILFLILSCKPTNKDIVKIEFQYICGGKGCLSTSSVYTKDSIINSFFDWSPESFKKTKTINTPEKWQKLIENIDIGAFKKIKSDSGRYQYDGVDVNIIIFFSNKKKLKISNGESDSIYFPKVEKLREIEQNFEKK